MLIRKPATKGYENCPTLILQSHMDMVCEKHVDGEWMRAKGTTLGADDVQATTE